MPLLQFEHVSKQRRGWRALDDVSLVIDSGEMVTVFGERRSGRSTLLRIAAGIEAPDNGAVLFDGASLAAHRGQVQAGISYCRAKFRRDWGPTVVDQLVSGQRARRVPGPDALPRALHALERVDAAQFGALRVTELRAEEAIRVAVARALTADPRLLILDEPTLGLDPDERHELLDLLSRLANESVSVLTATGTGIDFSFSDRVLSLGDGCLRGELVPELAPVTDLSHHRRAQTAG
jgi:ABC-type multidrug transport system ATPase subunit